MRLHLSTLALALAGTVAAQVPHGDSIMSIFTNAAPLEGLLLVKRSGAVTPVTGLAATTRGADINSIQLDPIDNRVWIGGITASVGRLDHLIVLPTNVIANLTAFGNTGIGVSVSGIAFDDNSNPIVSSGTISTTGTGGIFRFDRKTGLPTRIAGGATWTGQVGTANCVCRDPGGSIYFGVTGAPATIYRLAKDNNGDYTTAAVALGTIAPPSSSSTISGLDYVPASGAIPPRLYWTTFGSAGTAVGYIPINGGAAVTVGAIGGNNAPNWVDYDAVADDMLVITGGINPDEIYKMDRPGAHSLIAQVPPGGNNGTPSAIDANDCTFAETMIAPNYLPAAGSFDLEFGTCCPAGYAAGVILLSPGPLFLATGSVAADGKLWVKFTNLNLPRGTPGILSMVSACFDRNTGRLIVGQPVRWPRN
jgi:hypothetical protein